MLLRRAQIAPVDERGGNLREQRERKNVLFAPGEILEFLAVLGKLRLQKVGGTAGNSRLVAPDFLVKFGIGFCGKRAVFTVQQTFCFLGYHFVAFAHNDVQDGLRADDLACGRNERRITQILSHAGYFFQNFLILIACVLLFQLIDKV